MLNLTVIVPVRNAEGMIHGCLDTIIRAEPCEIIIVDGKSTDRTLEIARNYPVRILSDDGLGVAAARMIGARAASTSRVALIDVDIVLPDGALAALLEEFTQGQYAALQAGLNSVSGEGYWGRALVDHHRLGRSKNWPGVMATIFDRETLLRYGFDEHFLSGEDIELRWRLRRGGERLGVSRRTIVTHRYDDTFEFALGQWIADGHGLGRMICKFGWSAAPLLALPLAGSLRGTLLSLARLQPQWLPYYACYLLFNYIAIFSEFGSQWKQRMPLREVEGQL
jgi:glycosyltransferase involved in cell wall biosynthesis